MRILIFVILTGGFHLCFAQQQKFIGIWEGKINVGAPLRIILEFSENNKRILSGILRSPDQSPAPIAADTTYTKEDSIFTGIKKFGMAFKGKLMNDSSISGSFVQGVVIPLQLKKLPSNALVNIRADTAPKPNITNYNRDGKELFTAEEKTLSTPTGKLKGTLISPRAKNFPVLVIQAGSGPTDRNGNNPMGLKANSYRLIAEELAKKNVGTLLIDKRGIAASASAINPETMLRFDDYINDLAEWIKFIKKDKRTTKVFIAGHSEGSLVGMGAAQKEKVNGYISLAGAGERIDKIFFWQLNKQSPGLAATADSMLARLRTGKKLDSVPPPLVSLLNPSMQAYMASWMKYEPCAEIKKLHIPIIIIQGTTDIQVQVKEARMLKSCNPAATLTIITGMNHILKPAPADVNKNVATYADGTLPLMPGLADVLTNFILKK